MSNSILFDWGKFLLFFAISSSFLCAQDGKIIMDGFGDTHEEVRPSSFKRISHASSLVAPVIAGLVLEVIGLVAKHRIHDLVEIRPE